MYVNLIVPYEETRQFNSSFLVEHGISKLLFFSSF